MTNGKGSADTRVRDRAKYRASHERIFKKSARAPSEKRAQRETREVIAHRK